MVPRKESNICLKDSMSTNDRYLLIHFLSTCTLAVSGQVNNKYPKDSMYTYHRDIFTFVFILVLLRIAKL